MPMTLAEMKVGMSDKVAAQVVDIFLRVSEVLQMLPFDNCVSPSGGSTLTYTYMQTQIPAMAAFRALNTEYTANEAKLIQRSADLKVFGGKFQMDRVLKQAEGKYNNMAFQMEQKILAAVSLFHHTLINGDAVATAAGDAPEFEGLDSMLAGTSTEFNAAGIIDLSDIEKTKANADQFYEALSLLIKTTKADALLMNTQTITKIQTVARILGYKTETEEAFGKKVASMDGVRFMDLGYHYTVSDGVAVPNSVVKVNEGLTDIYGVKFDVNDGFHGISLNGSAVIDQYLPNFNDPGVMKNAEVEMIAATVLKNTQHAGVLRNIKIA